MTTLIRTNQGPNQRFTTLVPQLLPRSVCSVGLPPVSWSRWSSQVFVLLWGDTKRYGTGRGCGRRRVKGLVGLGRCGYLLYVLRTRRFLTQTSLPHHAPTTVPSGSSGGRRFLSGVRTVGPLRPSSTRDGEFLPRPRR